MLLTLYGGTTISCRKTAERLAAKITEHFGDDAPNISSLAKPEIV
jgi:glycerol-3-phosphate dehydrogenase